MEISSKRRKTESSIFDICEVTYVKNEDLNAYYMNFRSTVCKNLKRRGDKLREDKGHVTLMQDEVLSPTFEEIIVLWCLEKIDPLLPKLVKETFGNQLQVNLLKN